MEKALTRERVLPAVLFMILMGLVIGYRGRSVILEWHSIGPAFAAFGVVWILAGTAMFVAGGCVLWAAAGGRYPCGWGAWPPSQREWHS